MRADNVVNATGVWADRLRPDELHDEAEVPRIRPSRGTHITLAPRGRCPLARRRDRPRRRRADDLRPAVARPHAASARPTTTTTASDLDHIPPTEDDVDYLLDAAERLLRHGPRAPDDITGAYAGVRPLISTGDPKKSVDISRKAELYETSSGMITITGGKLDDLAADGQAGRRPARRARGPRRAVPHARDPARAARSTRTSCRGSRACPRTPTARSPAATATPPTTSCASPRSAASSPSRSSTGLPDLLAEVVFAARHEQARTRRRRAAAAHARWACWPPASSLDADGDGGAPRRRGAGAASWAGTSSRDRRARSRVLGREAAAEGIVVTA